jgi:hypothetical protein
MTLIWTIDGKRMIEINGVESNLKMACVAETKGDLATAWRFFNRALENETTQR